MEDFREESIGLIWNGRQKKSLISFIPEISKMKGCSNLGLAGKSCKIPGSRENSRG